MSGSVDKVENVLIAVAVIGVHLDGVALDGNSPFPFQLHIVQDLILHIPLGEGMRHLQQAVGQSGLAVINVGNDAEVADELGFHTGEFTCMPLRHQDTK